MAMRYGRLDLNLLVALDALLTERSVSLAADRLCLSQSATSSALGRLRDYFGDELLVVKGRNMILTTRAEELIEPVRAVLEQIRTTVAIAPPFDPLTADRQVRIMASDYSTQVMLAEVLATLATIAPNLRFEIQPMSDTPIEAIERGYVDLLLTIDCAVSSDHPSLILFEDDYVVVGDPRNPAMGEPMTRQLYFSLGHVTARFLVQPGTQRCEAVANFGWEVGCHPAPHETVALQRAQLEGEHPLGDRLFVRQAGQRAAQFGMAPFVGGEDQQDQGGPAVPQQAHDLAHRRVAALAVPGHFGRQLGDTGAIAEGHLVGSCHDTCKAQKSAVFRCVKHTLCRVVTRSNHLGDRTWRGMLSG